MVVLREQSPEPAAARLRFLLATLALFLLALLGGGLLLGFAALCLFAGCDLVALALLFGLLGLAALVLGALLGGDPSPRLRGALPLRGLRSRRACAALRPPWPGGARPRRAAWRRSSPRLRGAWPLRGLRSRRACAALRPPWPGDAPPRRDASRPPSPHGGCGGHHRVIRSLQSRSRPSRRRHAARRRARRRARASRLGRLRDQSGGLGRDTSLFGLCGRFGFGAGAFLGFALCGSLRPRVVRLPRPRGVRRLRPRRGRARRLRPRRGRVFGFALCGGFGFAACGCVGLGAGVLGRFGLGAGAFLGFALCGCFGFGAGAFGCFGLAASARVRLLRPRGGLALRLRAVRLLRPRRGRSARGAASASARARSSASRRAAASASSAGALLGFALCDGFGLGAGALGCFGLGAGALRGLAQGGGLGLAFVLSLRPRAVRPPRLRTAGAFLGFGAGALGGLGFRAGALGGFGLGAGALLRFALCGGVGFGAGALLGLAARDLRVECVSPRRISSSVGSSVSDARSATIESVGPVNVGARPGAGGARRAGPFRSWSSAARPRTRPLAGTCTAPSPP